MRSSITSFIASKASMGFLAGCTVSSVISKLMSAALFKETNDYIHEINEIKPIISKPAKIAIVGFVVKDGAGANQQNLEIFLAINRFLQQSPEQANENKPTAKELVLKQIRTLHHNFCSSFLTEEDSPRVMTRRQNTMECLKFNFVKFRQLTERVEYHQKRFTKHKIRMGNFLQVIDQSYASLIGDTSNLMSNFSTILRNVDEQATIKYAYELMRDRSNLARQISANKLLASLMRPRGLFYLEINELQNFNLYTKQMITNYQRETSSCIRGVDVQREEAIQAIRNSLALAFYNLSNKIIRSDFGKFRSENKDLGAQFTHSVKRIADQTREHHRRHSFFICMTTSRLVKNIEQLLSVISKEPTRPRTKQILEEKCEPRKQSLLRDIRVASLLKMDEASRNRRRYSLR